MPAGSQGGDGQVQPAGLHRLRELAEDLAPAGIEDADVNRSRPIRRNAQPQGRVARPMEPEDVHIGQVGGRGGGSEAGEQVIAQGGEDVLLDCVIRAGRTAGKAVPFAIRGEHEVPLSVGGGVSIADQTVSLPRVTDERGDGDVGNDLVFAESARGPVDATAPRIEQAIVVVSIAGAGRVVGPLLGLQGGEGFGIEQGQGQSVRAWGGARAPQPGEDGQV